MTTDYPTLVVARRAGRSFKGYRLNYDKDSVGPELLKRCAATDARIARSTVVDHSPLLQLQLGEALRVPSDAVRRLKPPRRSKKNPEPLPVEVDTALDSMLKVVTALEVLPARLIGTIDAALYACVFHNADGELTKAYVQPTTSTKLFVRPGKLRLAFVNQQLTTLEENTLFSLEDDFQLVVETTVGITALTQSVFERFYRDVEFLKERAAVYVRSFSTSGVLTDPAQIELVTTHCRDHPLDLHRLRAVHESGVLSTKVNLAKLKQYAKVAEMESELFGANGELIVTADTVPLLLRLLDEDYAKGPLTGTLIEITAKRPR